MSTKKIYGPWIKWHGGECPVPPDTKVKVKLRCGVTNEGKPASDWSHIEGNGDIVEYCTITEQADLEAAEQLLRANDYTITPPAKPLTFEDVVPMTEAPPKGTEYWVVSEGAPAGVYSTKYCGSFVEKLFIKRRMAYLELEHALIAARHIFGLKGGEL